LAAGAGALTLVGKLENRMTEETNTAEITFIGLPRRKIKR
jgi:hypothetical protein